VKGYQERINIFTVEDWNG